MLLVIAANEPPCYLPVWSEWILAETWRTLAWRWLVRATLPDEFERESLAAAANAMMHQMLPIMTFVSLRQYAGPSTWPELRDQNDAPIWQTAVLASAEFVVSQNVHHFPPPVDGHHIYRGVEYVTAIEFVEDVLGMSAATVYGRPLPSGALLRSLGHRERLALQPGVDGQS